MSTKTKMGKRKEEMCTTRFERERSRVKVGKSAEEHHMFAYSPKSPSKESSRRQWCRSSSMVGGGGKRGDGTQAGAG